MVSPASDLYRAHPDWCLHVPHRPRAEGRHQLVLDLSRDDVLAWIIDWMTDLLTTTPIDYIKWDMNRNMTEVGSPQWPADRQAEISHRYILVLYHVLETLTARFPQVLFEGCSGGGGRFDPGMLYYMPETWMFWLTPFVYGLAKSVVISSGLIPMGHWWSRNSPRWYSQHSLIGVGSGFSGCVNQRIPALWADLDFTSSPDP